MKCYSCRTKIAEDSKHCPNCGVQISPFQADSTNLDQLKQDKALTEANLQRMRGNWDRAEILAVDALRLNPHSVQAHSLLGDICVGQNKLSQAAQWYQLALDIQPDSPMDRAKLDEVEKLIVMHLASGNVMSSPHTSDTHLTGTQKLIGLSPSRWFQIIWLLGAVFLVTIVILYSIYSKPRRNYDSSLGTLKDPVSPAGNAVLPDMSQALRTTSRGNPLPGNGTSPGRMFEHSASTSAADKTLQVPSRENALTVAISDHLSSDTSVILTSTTINKNTETATVAINIQVDPKATTLDVVRTRVVIASSRAVFAGYLADPYIKSIDISARITDGKVTEDFFYGSTVRDSTRTASENSDYTTLLKMYKNAWWAYPTQPQSDLKNDTSSGVLKPVPDQTNQPDSYAK